MIPVGWLSPSQECWDSNLIRNLTSNKLYPTGLKFRHHTGFPPYHQAEGTILVLPGRYYSDHTDKINEALSNYRWVIGIKTSDEEDLFDTTLVRHPQLKWWIQTPRREHPGARLIGLGPTPHFNSLPSDPPEKCTDVFLSGQRTHGRRRECFEALESWDGSKVVRPTEGFTEGFEPREYVAGVTSAKVCPAPSGAVSPDTFRLYEALEAHCVPIADDVSPAYNSRGYWRMLFPDAPFPIIEDYASLPGYLSDVLEQWPANANRIAAWWIRHKRQMALDLVADLTELGACA